jgi:hypothetical protein
VAAEEASMTDYVLDDAWHQAQPGCSPVKHRG